MQMTKLNSLLNWNNDFVGRWNKRRDVLSTVERGK